MKKFSAILPLLFLLISCSEGSQPAGETKGTKSKHSAEFNQSVNEALNAYYALSEAFVNWDSTGVNALAKTLAEKLKVLPIDEIKKDSAAAGEAGKAVTGSIMANEGIISGSDLTAKRKSFDQLTQQLFDFLRAARYDEKTIYLQECQMAFNDEEAAVWLTDKGKDSIRNPYLGLHHPRYKAAMLECGSNKSAVDYSKE